MELETLLEICRTYRDLGWPARDHLEQLAEGNLDGLAPADLEAPRRFLRELERIAERIDDDQLADDTDSVLSLMEVTCDGYGPAPENLR